MIQANQPVGWFSRAGFARMVCTAVKSPYDQGFGVDIKGGTPAGATDQPAREKGAREGERLAVPSGYW